MDYTKLKQEQDTLYQKASAYQKNDINYSQQPKHKKKFDQKKN